MSVLAYTHIGNDSMWQPPAVVKVKGLQLQCMMGRDDRFFRRHAVHDL